MTRAFKDLIKRFSWNMQIQTRRNILQVLYIFTLLSNEMKLIWDEYFVKHHLSCHVVCQYIEKDKWEINLSFILHFMSHSASYCISSSAEVVKFQLAWWCQEVIWFFERTPHPPTPWMFHVKYTQLGVLEVSCQSMEDLQRTSHSLKIVMYVTFILLEKTWICGHFSSWKLACREKFYFSHLLVVGQKF